MKKVFTLLLCAVLLVGLVGCAAPVDKTGGTTTTTTDTGAATTTITTTSHNTDNSWEGQGGDFYNSFDVYSSSKHTGLKNFYYGYVLEKYGMDRLSEGLEKVNTIMQEVPFSYTGDSMHFWVREFNISKETFIELNEKSKEFYGDVDFLLTDLTFTDEEIDDIYSLSIKEFNEKYKAPTAALVGEVLFSFHWLLNQDVSTWQLYDFSVEQLQEILTAAKANSTFPDEDVATYEKKLNDYIAAVGVQAVE